MVASTGYFASPVLESSCDIFEQAHVANTHARVKDPPPTLPADFVMSDDSRLGILVQNLAVKQQGGVWQFNCEQLLLNIFEY